MSDKSLQSLYDEWEESQPAGPASATLEGYRRAKALRLVAELTRRRQETLRMYEPLPHLAKFHESDAPERVVRGSNRSGKTVCAAVEAARILTNQDPYNKYPKQGKMLIVGKDGRHLADPIYRALFKVGLFKVLKDGDKWRLYRPWDEQDKARERETAPAPPLIPPRFYEASKFSWESKKENWPKGVELNNGWEVMFCTGQGKPPQGIKVNAAWFDEEIPDEDWYNEVAMRLVDDWGLFFWSATAQLGGVQLYDLCQRAERERLDENPSVVEIFAHINDNKHFTDEQRKRVFAKLTDEQLRIRIEGEFAFANQRIYPEFSRRVHGADWFEIPADWTRYAAIDPGRQVAAAIFAAVPPPSWRDPEEVYFYDEVYVQAANAKSFAEKFRDKAGATTFQAFIIDHHGGRLRDLSMGYQVEDQYRLAFKKLGLESRTTGSGFIWGADDLTGGIEKLRSWLLVRDNGRPKLRYFPDKMPNFAYQMDRYHYKRDGTKPTDKPIAKNCDLPDAARYLAMYDLRWVRPTRASASSARIARRAAEMRRKRNKKRTGVSLGPGGTG